MNILDTATMVALEQSPDAYRVGDIKALLTAGKGLPITSNRVCVLANRDSWKVAPDVDLTEVLANLHRLLDGDYIFDAPNMPPSMVR